MGSFNERWCIYGATMASRLISDKEFLHSFLREDSAKGYVEAHRGLFPDRYPCYDVYVGGQLRERIQVS